MRLKTIIPLIFLFFLIGCASATPTMTSAPEATSTPNPTQTATQTSSPTATLSPEQQIIAMVNEAKETGIFPVLTKDQMGAFIEELNRQCGDGITAIEVLNKPNSMMISVSPNLYPNFAAEFASEIEESPLTKGTDYLFQVSKDFFTKHPDVKEKLSQNKWIQMKYELEEDGKETGNLMFFYDNKWQLVPNSAGFSTNFWNEPINANNLNEKIAAGEFTMPTATYVYESPESAIERGSILVPAIMLPQPETGLTDFALTADGTSIDMEVDLASMLLVHTFLDGNGNTKLLGERIEVSSKVGAGYTIYKEGSKQKIDLTGMNEVFRNGAIQDDRVVLLPNTPSLYWVNVDDWSETEDGMQNYNKLKTAFVRASSNLEMADGSNFDENLLSNDKILIVMTDGSTQTLIKFKD